MTGRELLSQLASGCARASRQAWSRDHRIKSTRVTAIAIAIIVLACPISFVAAAPRGRTGLDQQSRDEAISAIPFDQLTEETQAKLWGVVSQPSIYRQLPTTVVESDPDMHVFLVRYPEVVINMWQLMGVTKVQMKRTGDYAFKASDGAGTVCDVQLVYGDQNTHVYYAEGSYEGVLLRKLIRGSCVMVLKSEYSKTQDQHVYVTNRLDMFVQLDNVGAEILAKTLHPLVGKSADHNFTESTRFLGQISKAAETRSAGLQQLAGRLNNVTEPVRDQFTTLTGELSQRATLRDAGQQVWNDRLQATPVAAAPVVTVGPAMEGASQLFDSAPPRKPLLLRR